MKNDRTDPAGRRDRAMVAIAAVAIAFMFVASASFAFLGGDDNEDVVLGENTDVPILNGIGIGAIQMNIDLATSGDTITVTGGKTDVSGIETLNIPADVKVIWKATYTGLNDTALILKGAGTFEIVTLDGTAAGDALTGRFV